VIFQKYFSKNLLGNAPINVNPEGGGGGDLTFLQKKMSNATPSVENSWAKFPTPGMKFYS
jgi:hypothetical protein